MMISRRGVVAGAAGLCLPGRWASAQTADDGFQVFTAQAADLGLLEDGAGHTGAWIFGPAVIRARQGQEAKLRFANALDHDIWMHFFGVRGPSESMTFHVEAGAAADVVFVPPDAGTFWIGPVADVSKHRDMGLVAMFAVGEAAALNGIADLPLVFDDWIINDGGGMVEGFGDVEAMVGEGRLGNWFTVNNRFRPRLGIEGGRFTRLRILNAANVRTMGLMFKGHDPLLIARDGQPLRPAPLGQKALFLSPGQRADLLVSPQDGDITVALDLFEDVVEVAYLTGEGRVEPPHIDDNFALPANPAPVPAPSGTERRIPLVLEGGIKGGLKQASFKGQVMDLRTLLENGKGWAINGVAGPSPEPLFMAAEGETVVLDVTNKTAFEQPIHIHGHVWQLPGSDAAPGALSDTAAIAAGETMQLVFVADNPGTWAIQSLLAERFDGGLFGAFSVTAAADAG